MGPLIIDKREHRRDFVAAQLAMWAVPTIMSRLDAGDYVIPDPMVGIGRKSWPDLLSSLNRPSAEAAGHGTKSLLDDIRAVRDMYDVPVFLLEGWEPRCVDEQTGRLMRREENSWVMTDASSDALDTLLLSIQLKGVLVMYSASVEHTALLLASTYRYFEKPFHRVLSAAPRTRLNRMVQLFGAMPGVDEKRAVDLAGRFPTVWDFLARLDELEGDGIGPVTAKNIREFVNNGHVPERAERTKASSL